MSLSPMMKQYNKIKSEHSDCLIFFRLGDFYELFFDDAKIASRILELTLTGKSCGLEERAPMCGVPYHAADTYIARLVKKGYKVAIVEQVEDPATAKGLVDRDVIRIVTPGTIDIIGSSDSNENIYIAALSLNRLILSISYADITTGELVSFEIEDASNFDRLIAEISKISPKELILSESTFNILNEKLDEFQISTFLNVVDSSYFKISNCKETILNHFNVSSLLPLDIDGHDGMIESTGALLLYLTDTQKQDPSQITELTIKRDADRMLLDKSTMRNLELLETIYDNETKGSLLGVLDKTKTAMGGRMLKSIIKEPLINSDMIKKRLDAVEVLVKDSIIRNELSSSMKEIYDFERLTARIASMKANGKDLISLKKTLTALPSIIENIKCLNSDLIQDLSSNIDDFSELRDLIDEAIVEEPPFTITDGSLIKDGYSKDLDLLKDSIKDAKNWISNLETTEKKRTGIKTLKVGFNKVFGYYIDVSKLNIHLVPDDYIRKQTLVNNERYITPELKEKEGLVLSAEAKINAIEYEIFKQIRNDITAYIKPLQKASGSIALLDVLISFAEVASSNGYTKPEINDDSLIEIRKGRHPAVEQMIGDGLFVANDTLIDYENSSMLVITGPNMSGKSTYMRQTAIIVLMAQMGSFVPCERATIGITDRVFTRIGASDNLSSGQSTFFIEMSELSGILRNATRRSLIILDEIGRGTSTFDGLSIAWATIEYLCKTGKEIRTMFATHYHELTALAKEYPSIKNLSVAVSENGNDIVFLHSIDKGPASKSYGIHVAKIAGIPKEIRRSAQQKLKDLETNNTKSDSSSAQLSFFESQDIVVDNSNTDYSDVIELLDRSNLDEISPINALLLLKEVKDKISLIEEDEQ